MLASDQERLDRAKRSVAMLDTASEILNVNREMHERRLELASTRVKQTQDPQAKDDLIRVQEQYIDYLRSRLDEIEQAGKFDAMTGAYKREAFIEALRVEWNQHANYEQPIALLFIDVDNFKAINDTFGHRGGDAILAGIGAQGIRCLRRSGEVIGRYGGDEFVVLLPQTSLDEASGAAERFRKGINAMQIPVGNKTFSPTVTVGVASVLPHRTRGGYDTLLHHADDALMYAKRSEQRNKCFAHQQTEKGSVFAEIVSREPSAPKQERRGARK
jgi:diguanylate cyclase (GGDEF)-like protein